MDQRYVSVLLTFFVVLISICFWFGYHGSGKDLGAIFTPEQVSFLNMYDSTDQQKTHQVALLSIAVFSLLGICISAFKPDFWSSRVMQKTYQGMAKIDAFGGVILVLLGSVLFYFYFRTLPTSNYFMLHGGVFSEGFRPSLKTYLYVLAGSVLSTVLIARFANYVRALLGGKIIVTAVALYSAFLMLPGFFETLNLSRFSPNLLTGVEWHYSGVLGPADRLAAGLHLFKEVQLHSGPLLLTLLTIAERFLGPFDFSGHVRITQLLQVAFFILLALSYWLWRPNNRLFFLIALLFALPWIHTYHAAILYPNQSAWRSIGFPLAALAMLLTRRQSIQVSGLILGFCAGGIILINIEIGLCILGGYVVFLVTRTNPFSPRNTAAVLARFAAGALLAFIVFALIFRVGLGYWPIPQSFRDLFLLITRFSGGYAGLRLSRIDPLALLIFLHASWLVIYSAMRWKMKSLPFAPAFKAAIATIIVIWFAYYAKGPHFWNLWTFIVLYGFLLSSYLDTRLLAVYWRRLPRLSYTLKPTILSLIILPSLVFPNIVAIKAVAQGVERIISSPVDKPIVISGVQMPRDFAKALTQKAAYLEKLHVNRADNRVIYITADSFVMPLLTNFYPRLPFQDVFFETITKEDFEILVAWIQKMSPEVLLFDQPGTPLAGYPDQQRFFARLSENLAGSYVLTSTVDGWQVWERKKDGSG